MDKIICAGKNYLEHAKEMKDRVPEKPVLFLKPPSVLKTCTKWQEEYALHWPQGAKEGDIHYECELVFLIAQEGYCLSAKEAQSALSHVTVGLDMTNRTLQRKAKDAGGPWEIGKVFPDAAIIGPWLSLDSVDSDALQFTYELNEEIHQHGNSAEMRLSLVELLRYASQYFPLCAGDLLFTGTPAGVGAVKRGDIAKLSLQEYNYTVRWC